MIITYRFKCSTNMSEDASGGSLRVDNITGNRIPYYNTGGVMSICERIQEGKLNMHSMRIQMKFC